MNPKSYVITWTPRSNEYNLKHRLDLNISIAKDIRIQIHGYLDYKLIWSLDICLFYVFWEVIITQYFTILLHFYIYMYLPIITPNSPLDSLAPLPNTYPFLKCPLFKFHQVLFRFFWSCLYLSLILECAQHNEIHLFFEGSFQK
jgi:hypothetical protein